MMYRKERGLETLTVLTVSPWEATLANTLEQVQHGVAATAVVTGFLWARMVLEHGYVAGVQGIFLSEDGGTHQNDLGAANTGLKWHMTDFSRYNYNWESLSSCCWGLAACVENMSSLNVWWALSVAFISQWELNKNTLGCKFQQKKVLTAEIYADLNLWFWPFFFFGFLFIGKARCYIFHCI